MEKGETSVALLVTEMQKGDIKAYDALFWRYHQAIYRNILKFVKDHDAAQDLLQDVFISLWEKRHMLDSQQPVSNWLYVVSYNRAISHIRKRLRDQVLQESMAAELRLDEAGDKALVESRYTLLNEALQQLSPQKRNVFTLCKIEGKSYEEAAETLQISKHTVKEYLSLATIAVKAYIKSHPGAGDKVGMLAFFYFFI
ncbi:RNA polymerase sigma factor [Hufsiella ginkgonis]|uniref:Sigma-70 family RNA polymerase sigma factor n=1 Tax=Hufsiella ginkgonis TaxID=2695274 RepID=A0A7K1XXT2_9SPHI|nr:sigma-70 family RNA polymerase sigma factor [Hufsiella ginkgonis]MXV15647.1 sigma-70 family RNA polymerase sigma factor [Hufsiella ginkgonis]